MTEQQINSTEGGIEVIVGNNDENTYTDSSTGDN